MYNARRGQRVRPGYTRRGTAWLVLAALLAVAAPARADELEYLLKAEFMERFTHFVDWPADAFPGRDAPFVFCVVGDSRISPYLERLAHDRRIKDRRAEVRHLGLKGAAPDPTGCHVLLIGPDERPHLHALLARVVNRPVLTVSDAEGFGKEGVLINFYISDDDRVRFEISSTEVKRSPLKINAQLLRLARVATGSGP
jgi:hypothetical protein